MPTFYAYLLIAQVISAVHIVLVVSVSRAGIATSKLVNFNLL